MQLAILQKTNEMKPMDTEIPIAASRNHSQERFESAEGEDSQTGATMP